jgi:hypothetical protein
MLDSLRLHARSFRLTHSLTHKRTVHAHAHAHAHTHTCTCACTHTRTHAHAHAHTHTHAHAHTRTRTCTPLHEPSRSYTQVNGVPTCASKALFTGLVRDRWGFDGYVVSDCDAIEDVYATHHFNTTRGRATAAALNAGQEAGAVACQRGWARIMRASIAHASANRHTNTRDINVPFPTC